MVVLLEQKHQISDHNDAIGLDHLLCQVGAGSLGGEVETDDVKLQQPPIAVIMKFWKLVAQVHMVGRRHHHWAWVENQQGRSRLSHHLIPNQWHQYHNELVKSVHMVHIGSRQTHGDPQPAMFHQRNSPQVRLSLAMVQPFRYQNHPR